MGTMRGSDDDDNDDDDDDERYGGWKSSSHRREKALWVVGKGESRRGPGSRAFMGEIALLHTQFLFLAVLLGVL